MKLGRLNKAGKIGLGGDKTTDTHRCWATHFSPELLSDMTDESAFVLTNAEFTTEQAHSGTKSIKMNIPAGGTSTVRYNFHTLIDMRRNSINFKLKAVNQNVSALSIGYCRFGYTRYDGTAQIKSYSSACPINSFRPIGDWVSENVTHNLDPTITTLYTFWAGISYIEVSFSASAANAVTIYLDTIVRQPQPAFPALVLVSADDGYLTYGTIAADAAEANNVKLSVAVTKSFTEAGQHTISGALRSVMTFEQLAEFAARGHEVCNHSLTHPNIQTIEPEQAYNEIYGWALELAQRGYDATSSKVWIPTNGGVSDYSAALVKTHMKAQRNPRLFNDGGPMPILGNDVNNLMSSIYEAKTVEQINTIFDGTKKRNCLAIFYGHDVHTEAVAPHGYSIHIDAFTRMCERINQDKLISIQYKDVIKMNPKISDATFDFETYSVFKNAEKETFISSNIYFPSNRLLHYDMQNFSPNTLYDISGNNSHAATTDITYGTLPNRIIKSATTSKVNIPVAQYIGNSECTIIAAVRLSALPVASNYQAFYFESRNTNAFIRLALEIGHDKRIRLRGVTAIGTCNADIIMGTFPLNEWCILVGRIDKTTTAGSYIYKLNAFFENGIRVERTSTAFANAHIDDTQPQKIEIFESAAGVGNECGDVIVYKNLLSNAEVLSAVRSISSKYMTTIVNP